MDSQRENHWDQERLSQGTAPNNFRPITCLPMMWKIPTGQIWVEIYFSLVSHGQDKHLGRPPRKIFGTILEMEQRKNLNKWTREQEN